MSIILVLLFAVGVIHFIYHGMFAPTLRTNLRYKLFAYRDEVRALHCQGELPAEAFTQIEEVINNAINFVPVVGVGSLLHFSHRLNVDAEFRVRVEESVAQYEAIPYAAAKYYRRLASSICFRAMVINGLPWAFYILPIFMMWMCYENIYRTLKEAVAAPEHDLLIMFPSTPGVQTVTA